ncbi:radical SAM family heme chaperone HemW [bacterium]|nr:radical SAM family heme chaperone HemW [candidate division CSSED10-310 bacterium]
MIDIPESFAPGLYIHIPFCRSRCRYCGFPTSDQSDTGRISRYLDAVIMELHGVAPGWNRFDSLYLGGGTPSIVSLPELERLVESVNRHVKLAMNLEFTMEVNAGDVSRESVAAWTSFGVNRISLGVQALDDRALHLLGRRHTSAQALEAVAIIQEAGVALGIDLIFGYPGQTQSDWVRTLDHVASLHPDHLSCYQMTVETGTEMAQQITSGELIPATQDQEASLFRITHDHLTRRGYDHYEISNYAADAGRMARHNTKYWFRIPVLGIGAAAHSFDGRRRWCNAPNAESYWLDIESGRSPIVNTESLNTVDETIESIFLGIRTRWGFPCDRLPPGAGSDGRIRAMRDAGWIREDHGRITATDEGFAVADAIAEVIIAAAGYV